MNASWTETTYSWLPYIPLNLRQRPQSPSFTARHTRIALEFRFSRQNDQRMFRCLTSAKRDPPSTFFSVSGRNAFGGRCAFLRRMMDRRSAGTLSLDRFLDRKLKLIRYQVLSSLCELIVRQESCPAGIQGRFRFEKFRLAYCTWHDHILSRIIENSVRSSSDEGG